MTKKTKGHCPDWVSAGIAGMAFMFLVVLAVAVFFAYIAAIVYTDPTWLWLAIPGTLGIGFAAGVVAEL